MKVWIKLLIGSVLGIILGFLLPHENETLMAILSWLEGYAIQIGRYAVAPALLFSLTIAIYELRQDGGFWGLILRSVILMALCTVVVLFIGIVVIQMLPSPRIPILIEERVEHISLGTGENFLELFPSNMFSVLISEGTYLLPLWVFAFFLGIGLSYDRNYTKPVIAMLDSLSRIFYHILSFFSEILAPAMIVLCSYWAVRYSGALRFGIYRDLLLLLGIFSTVLGFGILPLFLYLLPGHPNPWAILYGSLGPAITAYFSGDINFTLPVLLRHAKENLGTRRRLNTITLTLFSTFCRAGSAMVAALSFIVIIKSYSSLGVTMGDLFAIGFQSFLISFMLARHPGSAAFTALAVLCLQYGRGYEAGYLILRPIAFYLVGIGTFLDAQIASFATFALARITGFQEDKSIRYYI